VKELKAALRKAPKASIDKKDEWYRSPLAICVPSNAMMCELFREQTPLHVGCFEGHFGVVKALVKAKANVNVRDQNNWCPPPLRFSLKQIVKLEKQQHNLIPGRRCTPRRQA